jgi:hypothetical protein
MHQFGRENWSRSLTTRQQARRAASRSKDWVGTYFWWYSLCGLCFPWGQRLAGRRQESKRILPLWKPDCAIIVQRQRSDQGGVCSGLSLVSLKFSLVTQSDDWIYSSGSACRDKTGQRSDECEQCGNGEINRWIECVDLE